MSTRMWLFALLWSGCVLSDDLGKDGFELGDDGIEVGDDDDDDDDDDDVGDDDDDDDDVGDDDDDDDDDDDASGDLAACAGEYRGTYDGADQGVAAATLHEDGTLEVVFTSDSGEVNAEGRVTDSGDVSGEEGNTSITGEMDFDSCRMSGTWYSFDVPAGSWDLERQ
jgi:hypothetical protein